MNKAFLPQLANELPAHRVWDHKIEIIPGGEPPYDKNRPLSSPELKQAFDQQKNSFTSAPTLAYFDFSKKGVLETDASDWASGGALSQIDDFGQLRPVAFFSSKHSPAECNYEIYDKELLAIIKYLEEWRPELQGTSEKFDIITDHKNLEYFTTTKSLTPRQVRWSEFLSQFNFQIVYRPGSKAIRPDELSRKREHQPNINSDDERLKYRKQVLLSPFNFEPEKLKDMLNVASGEYGHELMLAAVNLVLSASENPIDQLIDEAYSRSKMARTRITCRFWSQKIKKVLRIAMVDCRIVANKVCYREKLFLPPDEALRTQVIFKALSSGLAGYPGRTKTLDLLSRTYWWLRMSHDVKEYVRACALCIRTKSLRSSPQGFLRPLSPDQLMLLATEQVQDKNNLL
ncbi:hypothetical protein K3495_g7179 [Podosphaera aphanis]|nr:hypothetical protein K3495_g7179 [Podosphaera aphanis]